MVRDREAGCVLVHGYRQESDMTEWLNSNNALKAKDFPILPVGWRKAKENRQDFATWCHDICSVFWKEI